MTPYILQPSRLQSKTLIDNIFFNSLEFKSRSGNLLFDLIQFLIIENLFKRETLPKIDILKRDMRYFSENEFEELVINGFDWNGICDLEKNDPNHPLKRFFDTLHFYLDEMAPLRKLTSKERKLMFIPWISPEILRKCKGRDSIR